MFVTSCACKKILQYMKAINATVNTSQPVISQEDFNAVFYKIPDLHKLHQEFLEDLRRKLDSWDNKTTIGEQFKVSVMLVLSVSYNSLNCS